MRDLSPYVCVAEIGVRLQKTVLRCVSLPYKGHESFESGGQIVVIWLPYEDETQVPIM